MKLPITSWKKTLKTLGYKVVRQTHAGSRRKKQKTDQPISYQVLEPRQLLAGDTLIHVVDKTADDAFQYTLSGNTAGNFSLQDANNARGATTNLDGSRLFVINSNKRITVLDTTTNSQIGNWKAKGVSSVEGIASNGTSIWVLEKSKKRVHFFPNGTNHTSGDYYPAGYFNLLNENKKPSGITTDGDTFWVVDEKKDRVFVYDGIGNSLGQWGLDPANGHPTGIAIDPSGGGGIWVLDSKDDRVYFYAGGRNFTSGTHSSTSSFALTSSNRKGEGIAIDPATVVNPSLTPTILSISDDNGFSNNDGLTNDTTLFISGTADAGDTVTVSEASLGTIGSAPVDSAGNWTVDATAFVLTDGNYSFTATASNGTTTSDPSAPFAVAIDTRPTTNLAILAVDQDSGIDDTDGITNDNTLVVSGVTEPSVIVTLFETTLGLLGTTTSDGNGDWSIDLTSNALADGTYIFNATATDAAGNTTLPSAPFAVRVDTELPDAPAITSISNDTGANSTDNVTNDPVQTIVGTATPNLLIRLLDDDLGIIATTTSDSSGNWSITASFTEATYGLTAVAEDTAGNQSPASAPLTLVVDQSAPLPPVITGFDDDSGQVGDGITNDDTLIIRGTGEPGSFIALAEANLGQLGSATVGFDGNWSVDVTATPLSDATYILTAVAEDIAGNVSPTSQPLSISVDTSIPSAPSITRVDDDLGTSSSDGITSDNTLVLTGMAPAGSAVTVSEATLGVVGIVIANPSGVWELDATATPLADGLYSFTAVAEDTAGNSSLTSAPLIVEVDTLAPGPSIIDSIDSDTGAVADDGVTSDTTLVFSGTADPGTVVTLFEAVIGIVGTATVDASGQWQIDATGTALVDGQYSFTVSSEDLAGNIGPVSAPFAIEVDTAAPGTPSVVRADDDTGLSNSDSITNDNTLVLTGMAEPGAIVSVSESGLGLIGTAMANGSGAWTLDATSIVLADGAYTFTAIAEDVAGNMSPASVGLNVVVDTTAPTQTSIVSVATDNGPINSGDVTNDNTLVISGTAEPGTVVSVDESTLGSIGTVVADASGNWQFDTTGTTLVDGSYSFTTTSEDAAGNVSAASIAFLVVVDTTAPAAPSLTRVDDDRGASNNDEVTNDNQLVITGMAEPESVVNVFEATLGLIGTTTTDVSGVWTLDATSTPLADGAYDFVATATDAAGNTSSQSPSMAVVVDTVSPGQPTIDNIEDDTATANDGITSDNTLVFNGTAEANSVVVLSEGTLGVIGTATTDAAGQWQVDATDTVLADGAYSFSVVSEDLAGNISVASNAFNVVVDTNGPGTPSIVRVDDDNGESNSDNVTNDNTLIFSGIAPPNSTVEVSESTLGQIGSVTADSAGVWALDATSIILADGNYVFTAVSIDAAGNRSPASAALNVEVDTVSPAQGVILGVTSDGGVVSNGGATNDNTLTLNGTAEAASVVTIYETGLGVVGTITADASGNWQFDASGTVLADGTYNFTITSVDLAGNVSDVSATYSIEVDTTAPTAPSITRADDDSGVDGDDGITNDNTLVLTGIAEANSTVSVSEASLGFVGATTADGSGAWTLDLTSTTLADSSYSFTAIAEDAVGNVSASSLALAIEIDTVNPTQVVITSIDADTGTLADDGITNDNTLIVNGTAEPGTTVTLSEATLGVLGTAMTGGGGDWQFDASTITLADGAYSFSATSEDTAGNVSAGSASFDVVVDTIAPTVPSILRVDDDTGSSDTDLVTNDSMLNFTGMSAPESVIKVFEATLGLIGTTTADNLGAWTLDATAIELADGDFNFTAIAEDIAGNVSGTSATLGVVVDTTAPTQPVISGISDDTGTDSNDGITSDNTLIFSGTAEPQSEITVTDSVIGVLGTTTTDASGNWQLDATTTVLADGTYSFIATSTDLAGNSRASDPFAVQISTIVLDAPTIVAVIDDTGVSNSDGITNDSSLSITGIAVPSTTVSVFDGGTLLGTTVAGLDGQWSVEVVGLADGIYSLTATVEDGNGNTSGPSTAFAVVMDTVAPATTIDLAPAFDTAPLGDQTTTISPVTLIGTTDPGSAVQLQYAGPGGGPVFNRVADASGDYSFENIFLFQGPVEFILTSTDIAGNVTTLTPTFTNSNTDSDGPVITVELLNDTGDPTDNITSDPALTGTVTDASPLYYVDLSLYNVMLDIEYYDEITAEVINGEFTLDLAFLDAFAGGTLPFGEYEFIVDALDTASNYGFFGGQFVYFDADGDFDPPVVTVGLLNDTGDNNTDGITTDATLTGTVFDESPVMLTVFISDCFGFECGPGPSGDVTDLLQPDGSFVIPQTRLETIFGGPFSTDQYYVTVEATDQFNIGDAELTFDYVLLASPPVITSILTDSGFSNSDGITNDNTLSISGTADPSTEIELVEASFGSLGTVTSDNSGDWTFTLTGPGLVDGVYVFTAFALSSGFPSNPSNLFEVTVDTESPLRARFDLHPAFDTGVVGDSYTTIGLVTLMGKTIPGAQVKLRGTGLTATADVNGNFSILNVPLELGRHIYEIETSDAAGNKKISKKSIAYDQPFTLSETGFVTESTQLVSIAQVPGARTITFEVDAQFGATTSSLEDSFVVYLVDPNDTSTTLVDRGVPGTSVFSLTGNQADYLPGLVRFDGRVVEIDVSSITDFDQAMLLFQLINNDDDSSTVVSVSNVGSFVDEDALPSLVFAPETVAEPGDAFDVSGLTTSVGIALIYENIRYDSTTDTFTADLRVRNDGADVGRSIVATFDSLAGDVTFANPSGTNAGGNPYVSFRNAIPVYGLLAGQTSDAIRVEFAAPTTSPFSVLPIVSDGGANSAPVLDPIGTINVMPGDIVRVDLSATDADGEGFYYTINSDGDLPNTTLTANGQLIIAPSPDQVGNYTFDIRATDGVLSSVQPVTVNVVADAVTTTRISGVIMDTNSVPLAGIPVELGGVQVLTAADGTFELSFAGALPSDTLIVHGEAYGGPEVYPFIAEKLPLLYGHDAYENVNNFIERPIYLPALDVANGVTIDPAVDVTVTTSAIPNASVFVAAGSLEVPGGADFTGDLSITEVPADFTPAALPFDLFPDLVVTIQPGEMIFTTPAPLNLPNLAGYLPGTEMTLWSINPNTGLFDDVGVGVVSVDGLTVETTSGGINNSSWHFFAPGGPKLNEPNPRNQLKDCNECEETDLPNSDNQPQENSQPHNDDIPINTDSVQKLVNALDGPLVYVAAPGAHGSGGSGGSGGRRGGGGRSGGLDGGWGTGGGWAGGSSGDFGPYGSWGGSTGPTISFGSGNTTPSNSPLLVGNDRNANDTEIALHSGAVYKSHDLASYQSLGQWHGLQLKYDSERADARPIISTQFNDIQNNLPNPTIATKLSLSRGNLTMAVPGFMGTQSGLTGGEHFFGFPAGASSLDVALQADMRDMPTGVYLYESTNRFAGNATGSFVGTASVARDRVVHVNTMNSAFGAGWGISGLLEVSEDPDGTVLIVDGSGAEHVFEPGTNPGDPYISPAGDFSTLIKLGDGRFQRTHTDQTVELYSLTNKLASITDRNLNVTQFQYNGDDNIEFIVDPVGLTTIFRYVGGQVSEIEDPAGRITKLTYVDGNLVSIEDPDTSVRNFDYDSVHRLTGEVDKKGDTEAIKYGFSGRAESVVRKDGSTVKYSTVQSQGLSRPDQTNSPAADVPAARLAAATPVAQKVDGNGNVTGLALDRQGQLLELDDAEGDQTTVGRNNQNLVERVVDGRGNLTIINHDERGNVISVSDAISRGTGTDPLFSDPVYTLAQYTETIVSADMNNDGFADIISASGTSGDSVSVVLANGAGGYRVGVNFSVLDPVAIHAADVNNDGKLDVIAITTNDQVSVLLGNGDGTLQDAVYYATGVDPQAIESADFNQDGFIDLATVGFDSDTVSILLGDGTGQFLSHVDIVVTNAPNSLAIGDINNDRAPDIVVGHRWTANPLTVLTGVGDGTFVQTSLPTFGDSTDFVELEDVNGDGDLDIVAGDADVFVFAGNGDSTFESPQRTLTGGIDNGNNDVVNAIVFDADSDGDLDLIFAESDVQEIRVFKNNGSGVFALGQTIASGGFQMVATDVNFDGVRDIVNLDDGSPITSSDSTLRILPGLGDGTYLAPVLSTNQLPTGDEPSAIELGDFNNDGHDDVVVATRVSNTIEVMLGAGDGTLTALAPIVVAGGIIALATDDLDGDGNLDLVSAHYDSDTIEVRYGDGLGGFTAPISIVAPEVGPLDVAIGDFNNDNNLDIAAAGHKGAAEAWATIVLSNGNRTFGTAPFISARFTASTIDVGDFDQDGNLDFVVGVNYFGAGNAANPFLGDGTGGFTEQGRIAFGFGSGVFGFGTPPVRELQVVDIDADGILDIVGVDESQNAFKVLKGNGNGTFQAVVDYPMQGDPRRFDVGDVNNDGLLDVVATNFESSHVSVFFGLTDGTLSERQDFRVGLAPIGIQLIDLDEDGSLDFVTTNSGDNTISLRINSTDIANRSAKVYEYDPVFNQLTRFVDEEGREVIYDLDPVNGNTLSMTEVIGELGGGDDIVTSYTYTSTGLVDTITDPLGRVTDMDYDARGLLEKITFAVGTVDEAFISYEYDAKGNQTATIDELGHRTEYVFDALNRVTQVTEADPDGAGPLASPVTTNVYDDQGNLLSGTDALNNTTQFVYDEMNRLVETIDADLQSIKHEYDESGNLTATIDRLGRRTEFVYDERNRLVETIDAEGGRSANIYDEDNNVIATTDENVVTTRYSHDARNRLMVQTNALNGTLRYEYDRVDNLVAIVDELGRRTEMTYDELDRLKTTTLPDPDKSGPELAPVTTFVYDDASNLVAKTDALGNTTSSDFDERNRLVQLTESDPDGAGPLASPVWITEYDDASRVVRSIDPLNRETIFVYDDLNRMVSETLPDPDGAGPDLSPVVSYTYDAVHNRRTVTDALGNTTTIGFDDLYRVTSTTSPDPDGAGPLASPVTTFVLDVEGQLVSSIDPLGRTTVFAYDLLGRIITETLPDPDGAGPDLSPVFTSEYDNVGNKISTTDALGNATEYAYDDLYRVVEIIEADPDGVGPESSPITTMKYDAAHQLLSTTDPLGRKTQYQYDDLGRIVRETYPDPDGVGPDASPEMTYVYDLMDNELSMTDALGNTTSYAYDNLYRLTSTTEADPDDAGPLLSPVTTYTYDVASQLLSVSDPLNRTTQYEYDDLGRVIREIYPDPDGVGPDVSPEMTYVYDLMDNQLSMTDALGNTTSYAYDNLYRLTSTTEADPDDAGPLLSPVTNYTYDVASQLLSVSDPLNRTTQYEYDDLGRVIRETYPDPDGVGPDASPEMTYVYDLMNNELSMTDALGNTTSYAYDNLYRLTSTTEADPDDAGPLLSPVTTYTYDVASQLLSVSDPLNRTTQYEYDDLGRVIRETYPDPDGVGPDASPEMTYVYDLMDNELSMTDALGNTTAYAYDNLYRLTSTTEADPDDAGPLLSPVTTYTYDIASQLKSTVDALGRVTSMEYDDLGRLIRLTEPSPHGMGPVATPVTTYVYDLMSNELSMTDALGIVTQYEYDNLYRTTKVIQADPDGAGPQTNPTTTFEYDVASQVVSTTDPLGRISSFVFDDLGRVTTETYPDPDGAGPLTAPVMSYTYDLMNNELSMTDAAGNLTQYEYDNLYRVTSTIEADPDGAGPLTSPVNQYSYDVASQLLTSTDALNRTTTNEYDDLGRTIRVTQPDPDGAGPLAAPELSFVYDLMGNQLSMTDPVGNTTTYEYDNLYRTIREIGEDLDGAGPLANPTTEYAYDLEDNLLSLTDSSGNTTNYTYDDLDRLFEETIELGVGNFETRQFEYDLEDNLTRQTDRNGRVIEYEYDAIYRMVEERWLDPTSILVNTIQFEFDEASQMLRAEDLTAGSRYDYTYDDLSRVTQSVVNNGGPEVVFTNAYDAQSRRTERAASVGGVSDYRDVYSYDGLNRLSRMDQVAQAGGITVADKRFDIEYNADDQLTLISRYKSIAAGAGDLVMTSAYGFDGIGRLNDLVHANSASTITDYDWAYDAASRITQFTNSVDGASDFTYDNGNQLTGATHVAQSDEAYEYDEDGNRTSAGNTTGDYNRLTSDGTFNYQYDAEGNRTKRTSLATGEVTEYDWDHRNRLVAVTDRASDGGAATQIVEHRYDMFNRWISKSVDSDGDGAGVAETTRYQYDGNQIVLAIDNVGAVTNRYVWGPGVDQLLADEQVGGQVYWAATDHLGTIRDVVDANGNVANHIVYDSFGNVISETNATADVLFGYTGKAFEEATGLQNNLNRWYDAATGRWLSEDPIGFEAGDSNLYRYVGNNSLNATDPDGLDWLDTLANWSRGTQRAIGETAHVVVGSTIGGASHLAGKAAGAVGQDDIKMVLDAGATIMTDHAKNVHRNSEFMNNPRTVAAGKTATQAANGLTVGYGMKAEADLYLQEAKASGDKRTESIYGVANGLGKAVTALAAAGPVIRGAGTTSTGKALAEAYKNSAYAQVALPYAGLAAGIGGASYNYEQAYAKYMEGDYFGAGHDAVMGTLELIGGLFSAKYFKSAMGSSPDCPPTSYPPSEHPLGPLPERAPGHRDFIGPTRPTTPIASAPNRGGFGEVVANTPEEASFLRNARATFGEGSVFNSATRHRGNIVIQRSDIDLSIENLRRMDGGNSPFVRNDAGEWEALNLHHVGRQDGKLIEVLSSHNTYNPATGGPLHIPGPGGPLRQSRLSQTYWQQRLDDLINLGQVSDDLLRQLGR